jgi:hypothetical protein
VAPAREQPESVWGVAELNGVFLDGRRAGWGGGAL